MNKKYGIKRRGLLSHLDKRRTIAIALLCLGSIVFALACVQELERNGPPAAAAITATATPAPATPGLSLSPTPVPTHTPVASSPTPQPPSPTPANEATPVPITEPSPTPAPEPSPTPTEVPTPTPTVVPPPVLEVQGPANGATILYDGVVVFGFTSPESVVKVNGVDADLDGQGRFKAEIKLTLGTNTIEVVAQNAEAVTSRIINVVSLALPPLPLFLVVAEPRDQSVVIQSPIPLTGRTTPDAVLTVNGVSVRVDELGLFATTVNLTQGANIIDVVATDQTGTALSVVVAVIYRP